ncbi:Hypothetical protein R9X50_00654900 [Acrodontium crateriforme]|uniref:Eukaryotic translation initiation factor 3 subunit J n=1 Tax=Acrodontium crateriforme TaxID=150365 RepID=A0AAQ3R6W0_9PEZI|nr:Hypothetical protein R9X50_00654900 [Acrodontium crateriforme]
MAPSKSWDDEESDSTPPSSPPLIAARRGKFDDEEDGEVLDSWENDEDSEVEREKEKKAAEAKAKADELAKANHKTKSQRIEEKRMAALRRKMEEEMDMTSDEEETEAEKRARLRAQEQEADLKNAEDLFSGIGINPKRGDKAITVQEGDDPSQAVDLSSLKLFNPATAAQFTKLRETLVPLLLSNSKKPQYPLFVPEFAKQIAKDLSSEQIKKVASALTALSNEKLKEEKAADKGGKKTKAAKTKSSLNASRDVSMRADTMAYDDDGLDDGDFM